MTTSEGIEVTVRALVANGAPLQHMVNTLTTTFGQGTEIDVFHEVLLFKPQQQQGNMNFVNRDVRVSIEYRTDGIIVRHVGSSITGTKDMERSTEANQVTKTNVAEANIRRLFQKSGFEVESDFAKKGLEFKTRTGASISITRPYNAGLNIDQMFASGSPSWEPLGGQLPFGQDYLVELSQRASSENHVESLAEELNVLLKRVSK